MKLSPSLLALALSAAALPAFAQEASPLSFNASVHAARGSDRLHGFSAT